MNTYLQQLYSSNVNEIENALGVLNAEIQLHWSEISEELPKLVELSETMTGRIQLMAHLVASKSFFFIESYDEAVVHALQAGELFSFTETDNYGTKMVTHLIDMYIAMRQNDDMTNPMAQRIEQQMNIFFEESIQNHEYFFTCGIALDCKRVDIIERIITEVEDKDEMIEYLKVIVDNPSVDYELKSRVFEIICKTFTPETKIDIQSLSECLVKKNDCEGFLKMFETLSEEMKMQILLDYDGISQKFRGELLAKLPEKYHKYIDGKVQESEYMNFLFYQDKTDNLLLNNMKNCPYINRSSVIQMALLYANAYMHFGTTNITFLKDNNEWIVRASYWAKFATTATLGVLYKGVKDPLRLLSPFEPTGEAGKDVHAQSGRLYALGLIYAGRGTEIIPELVAGLKQGKNSRNDVVQHGGCLGLGLAGISTENMEIYQEVKEVMTMSAGINDSMATSGMAAGMAMGLIMMGSGNFEVVNEMIEFCHQTRHDKLRRGTGIGIALVMFGLEDKADNVIDIMLNDSNTEIKYGGIYTLAMAYFGTANRKAVSKLLQITMTERADEIKRAAVQCLGFILNRKLDDLCKTIILLIDSYNSHVRYGCAMALGIAGCASNNEKVINLLKPLLKDPVEFVKQGAAIAMGMVVMQASEKENKDIVQIMKDYQDRISSKKEGILSCFGNILGLGILNAGGRNCTISYYNPLGTFNMKAIAGLLIFTQYWYWYPLVLSLSLSFTPTTIIGVTPDLKKVEEYEFISKAPSNQFEYVPNTKAPQKTARTKIAQTKLSYVSKQKPTSVSGLSTSLLLSTKIDKMEEVDVEATKMEEEPIILPFVKLPNGSRVVPRQFEFIEEVENARYVAVRKPTRGLVILRDTQANAMEEDERDAVLQDTPVEMTRDQEIVAQALLSDNGDPKPPEPFEWDF